MKKTTLAIGTFLLASVAAFASSFLVNPYTRLNSSPTGHSPLGQVPTCQIRAIECEEFGVDPCTIDLQSTAPGNPIETFELYKLEGSSCPDVLYKPQ